MYITIPALIKTHASIRHFILEFLSFPKAFCTETEMPWSVREQTAGNTTYRVQGGTEIKKQSSHAMLGWLPATKSYTVVGVVLCLLLLELNIITGHFVVRFPKEG